ncbi:MAG TPA: family 2A encapsulin nanocompartment cargo protein cysteine desulfurase [Pseudomonadales bacterium]|nr:family 2A encapsulin nanocompartment cargo protein cysteine desulfurase [Pseudomonadales bacterium]
MTTPTPIVDAQSSALLPDEATLTRLANEFFAALPARAVDPAETPALPSTTSIANSSASGAPSIAPAASPHTPAPDAARTAVDFPSRTTGVPPTSVGDAATWFAHAANFAAALPRVGPPSGPAVSGRAAPSPFYFLDPVSHDTRAVDADLRPATPAARPDFYFVDAATAPFDASAHPAFDVHAVRRDFPILSERVDGKPLIWFDNAATTQKPQAVIDRLAYFYAHENSNVHRGAHALAARATDAYEAAAKKVARFLGASGREEIVFVRGATEGINFVAQAFGRQFVRDGDEIVISWLEHHANIVPWQQLAETVGAKVRVIPVDSRGDLDLAAYQKLLSPRTRIVAVSHVSNALGTITPVREIVEMAHRAGARVLIDGAQAVSHLRVAVKELDADFYVFSGHKVFGPTGIGAVYGKREVLESMPPWQGGGNMISDVTFEKTTYQGAPARFEAGTGNIADAVGLGAALDYVEHIGIENIDRYEHDLLAYATHKMLAVPGLTLIGTSAHKASVLSFVLDGHAPEDVGQALSREGIAVRAGHHCAQPIVRRFGHEATVRPSLAFYNTCDEVDAMVDVLQRLARPRVSIAAPR